MIIKKWMAEVSLHSNKPQTSVTNIVLKLSLKYELAIHPRTGLCLSPPRPELHVYVEDEEE